MTDPSHIFDVTDATFQTDVIERSNTTTVVIDLWAEWCGPCKTLGPILEKVIAETDGRVVLAKVDTDANQAVAQAFRVQSIPAVYAMRDGQVVDGFVGAQPEHMVREFVARLDPGAEPDPVEQLVAVGDEDSLRRALELKPDDEAATAALAALLVDSGRADEALALLARIPETLETRQIAARARTAGEDVGDIEARLTELLARVKGDDEARQAYVDLLDLMGPDDPRTADYRQRLARTLY